MAEWSGENRRLDYNSGNPLGRVVMSVARLVELESDRWFLWVPVFFGAGIGLYFALQVEPAVYSIIAALCITLSLSVATRSSAFVWTLCVACFCVSLGFADARLRTLMVAQPSLERTGGFQVLRGWVEKTEARLPRGHRITLRPFSSSKMKYKSLPHRVRFTSRFDAAPVTGSAVEVRLRLRRVPEPVMPGGFDFSRKAYFAGLGAVGFSLSPAQQLNDAPKPPFDIRLRAKIDGLRHEIERRILDAIPGERGAVVIALITGERGRIPEETLLALRNSGLAHMLAISGLHMALMAGSLFWLLRAGAAAFPALALQYPIKKWAAVLALLGGGFYLTISGGSIATQRAFLMMGIVFTAILLDRPALTLRNVAIAACVILALFPESLLDVSFQMSFAAVTALVVVYERTSKRGKPAAGSYTFRARAARKAGWYMGGIALTTLVAGIAVAPFAAFHFHKLAQFSLVANLAAMPPFGLVVMPAALAALITMQFGWNPCHCSSWPGASTMWSGLPRKFQAGRRPRCVWQRCR